ncbi:helix-turn-helix transcriptional regulator [Paenibacillus sp. M1]|uniref:Helix-turn-helix transcriptional regulator n=1 Tax=Paenibacillus haidiansis TaxID=1574488 RepID=A0ABU7VSN8_9BACL
MTDTTPILDQLHSFITQENLNLRRLAELAEINPGTLSSIFNNNKTLTVDHLDRITAVMKLPEGYFYEQYIRDFLSTKAPDWRRVRPFLYRCMELDKLDCIKQVVDLLMENLMYAPMLFEAAEDFFQQGKHAAAAILYESVASGEKHQHSERLALCQYRLFSIRLGDDQEQNYRAAVQFEPFVDRLDEIDQLDALKDVINTYRSLYRWDKVEELAKKLEYIGKIQYQLAQSSGGRERKSQKKTKRPLFTYIASAFLLRATVYEIRGNYELALQYVNAYLDLSWVKESDPETIYWINKYKQWAQANIYAYKLLSGDTSVLYDYVDFVESLEDEIMPALVNILEAANIYNINVDDIILKFESHITDYLQVQRLISVYSNLVMSNAFADFLHDLAYYYLHRYIYPVGFKYLLICLEFSLKINKRSSILKTVGLFEHFRHLASSETINSYQNLVNEVYNNEKKKKDSVFSS